MIVDCDRCAVRGNACQDCVITVLLGAPPEGVELDRTERCALDTLADAGMVPRLQLVDCAKDGGARPAAVTRCDHRHAQVERSMPDGERPERQVS
jgi:hypothetical protein